MVWARTTMPRTTPRYSSISKPSKALAVVTRMRSGMDGSGQEGWVKAPLRARRLRRVLPMYFARHRSSLRLPAQHRLLGGAHLVGPAQAERVRRLVQELRVLALDRDEGVGEGVERLLAFRLG